MPRKKPSEQLVDVAVMAALRHTLTYRVPDGLDVRTGQRVLVPLGNRRALGIALEPVARIAPGLKARDVLRVLDPEPVFSPELLTLGLWIAEYYVAPVGEVFRAMLPLRRETRRARLVEITDRGRERLTELEASLLEEARSGAEASLLRYLAEYRLAERAGAPIESVRRKFQSPADLVARAFEEGWIAISEVERERGERKAFSVRLAGSLSDATAPASQLAVQGPVPARATRPSPVARRILEVLEREGPAADHRELLNSARASLAALRKLDASGLVELSDAKRGPKQHSRESGDNTCGAEASSTRDNTPPPELTPAQT